jgi:biopolymer transport protein ExbD
MTKLSLYQIFLAGALLAAACTAACAEPKQVQGTGFSSLRARPCSISIQITRDNRDIVRTRVAGYPTRVFEIRNDDIASLRRHIQKSCETGQVPSVSIRADANAPFQSLVNVILEMVSARVASFEISVDARRIMMRIPPERPAIGQTEINLNVTAQGAYGVNEREIFEHLNLRDLSGLLVNQMSSKKCCFVIINVDAEAPVQAFMDAVAAIQLAAIDDYWISTRSDGNTNKGDERRALEQRVLDLENEQKRLLREVRKKNVY